MTRRPTYSPARLALCILLAWLTIGYLRTMAHNVTPTPGERGRIVACTQYSVRCGDLP